MRKLTRIPFTQEGYDALLVEQKGLKEKRKTAVINLKTARDLGDLSENGLYKGARFALNGIDGRLRQLDMLIKLGEVRDIAAGVVGIGSNVTLEADGKTQEYEIVGTFEVDPLNHKISLSSPLGRLIAGKKVGDAVLFETPKRKTHYTIKKIS